VTKLDGDRRYICAEIGQNHNGDSYTALRMMAMAERCGVDAIKFQFRDPEYEEKAGTLPMRLDDPYSGDHSYGATYREHRAALDLTITDLMHLKERHRYNQFKSEIIVTPCSPAAVDQLENVNYCDIYKIASKDLGNMELIEAVASTGKTMILSTGMAQSPGEVWRATADLYGDYIVCHSVSKYPTPLCDVNLKCLLNLDRQFENSFNCLGIGLSDHTTGIRTSVAAAAMGAIYIEKHITLSRAMKGRDHAASLEEPGLRMLISWVRDIEMAMGDGRYPIKGIMESQNGRAQNP